ncbi:MAG TPA: SGNH/GDSL hydrolase family protein [Polyangiaceae bacterium]
MSPLREKAATVSVSVVVGLLLIELIFRIAAIGSPAFVTVDRVTGVAHVPGARGWYTREGKGWVEIDGAGLRGPRRPLEKPPGALRIALLGDSFTEALQVNDEASYARVVERRLSELLGRPVEVLNFGVSGFGTAEEYLLLEHRVWRFSPDWVVVAFLTANDVGDNHPTLKRAAYLPSFRVIDGELRLDESYLSSDLQRTQDDSLVRGRRYLTQHSRLVQVVSGAALALQARSDARAAPLAAGAEAGLDMDVYREPATEAWIEAWDITERLLVAMRNHTREHGARFALVVLSNGVQVHPDVQRRRQAASELGVADLFYPDRRLQAFAEGAAIPALVLAPALAEEAARSHVFFHGFGKAVGTGHWNEAGHRAAGERIAAWLAAQSKQSVNEGSRGTTAGKGENP